MLPYLVFFSLLLLLCAPTQIGLLQFFFLPSLRKFSLSFSRSLSLCVRACWIETRASPSSFSRSPSLFPICRVRIPSRTCPVSFPVPVQHFFGRGPCVCVCVVFSRSRRPCEFLFLSVALVLYFSTAVSAGLTFFSFGFAPLCEQKKSWSHKTKKKGKEGVARQR